MAGVLVLMFVVVAVAAAPRELSRRAPRHGRAVHDGPPSPRLPRTALGYQAKASGDGPGPGKISSSAASSSSLSSSSTARSAESELLRPCAGRRSGR